MSFSLGQSATSAFRQRGYQDGDNGRPRVERFLVDAHGPAYREGYRAGRRSRAKRQETNQ